MTSIVTLAALVGCGGYMATGPYGGGGGGGGGGPVGAVTVGNNGTITFSSAQYDCAVHGTAMTGTIVVR
jgi:hypothetical protein